MQSGVPVEAQRAAYQSLLDSGYLNRAPSLIRILNYICGQYFQGRGDQIKEYNIAVEALEKPPQFDQKSSSVVRVEIHRLRKRLQQYYATVGADAPVELSIPEGSYVPVFLARNGQPTPSTTVPAGAEPKSGSRWWLGVMAACGTLALAGFVVWPAVRETGATPGNLQPKAPPPVLAITRSHGEAVRILAGRTPGTYSDRFGRRWSGDVYFTGGTSVTTPYSPVARAVDQLLYQSMREGNRFQYDIPMAPGEYEMRLYFAEAIFGPGNPGSGGETYRIFDVRLNGQALLENFDVIADAPGANTEDVRVFTRVTPAQDGHIHLEFSSAMSRHAFLNAIEIDPSTYPAMKPLRFVAGDSVYHDPAGEAWYPDWFATGGIFAQRAWAERGNPAFAIHRSERFGNFSYSIPVGPGRYAVVLHFAEAWFGPDLPGKGGVGSRRFDVYCNGEALLRDFDIFQSAGGSLRPLRKDFRNVAPNAQGKIVLSFVPVVNYAAINAIEIFPEPYRR
jgi:hypothetical protein